MSGSSPKSTSIRRASSTSSIEALPYTEPLSEGEDDDMEGTPAKDEGKRAGLDNAQASAAVEYRKKMLKEKEREVEDSGKLQRVPEASSSNNAPESRSRTLTINPLAPSSAFDESLKKHLRRAKGETRSSPDPTSPADEGVEEQGPAPDEERVMSRDWAAPTGKRIAVPVRIEPKVYFATERTFLVSSLLLYMYKTYSKTHFRSQKWLNTAVVIGSIATTLLNFVPPEDTRGLISAALFTFASLLAIAYSGGIYVFRTLKIRQRSADGLYYDKYGPTALCVVLFLALATNISMRAIEIV